MDTALMRTVLEEMLGMIRPAGQRAEYLYPDPCGMQKDFDSRARQDDQKFDAYAGHLVVFTSHRRDRVKIVYCR